ncbi:MAG: hypothetical protein JW982_15835 [Spirochaetes bacterium]|nr:hypothetical protein [Spirochaetota bacterium]
MKKFLTVTVMLLIIQTFNLYSQNKIKLPREAAVLLNKNSEIIFSAAEDLNDDGNKEYLVAIQLDEKDAEYTMENDRKLLILTKTENGFRVHSSNKKIMLCSECGGVMGDPFAGIAFGKKWFEVSHLGGSREKWGTSYKFAYSRKYDKWQLVEVNSEFFDALDPDSEENTSEKYTPPADFGMINFEDFDPNNFLGKGVQ